MTVTAQTLVTGGSLSSSQGTFYLSPGNVQITSAVFTNRGAGINSITIYLGRSGTSSVGPGNVLINALPLAPNQAYVAPELMGRNLAAGDFLAGFATNGSQVNMVVDGFVIT